MVEATHDLAVLLKEGRRLVAMQDDDPQYEQSLDVFVARIATSLRRDEWGAFNVLPLSPILSYGLSARVERILSATEGKRINRAAASVGNSDNFDRAINTFPFMALKAAAQSEPQLARAVLEWVGLALRAEHDLIALPPGERGSTDLGKVAGRLCGAFENVLNTFPSRRLKIEACILARLFLARRATLRFLFHDIVRGDKNVPSEGFGDAALAHAAVAPVSRLGNVSELWESADGRRLLLQIFARRNDYSATQSDLNADQSARAEYSRQCLGYISKSRNSADLEGARILAEGSAPANYSASGDYVELQSARAQIYDRLVRAEFADVDNAPSRAHPGRIGILVSSLDPSAETQAIIAHYEGLKAAGINPLVIIWPHSLGTKNKMDPATANFDILDLSDLPFKQRVSFVRQAGFECLLFMNNLTWGWSEYIAASTFRLAKVQIATYLSVVTVGFKNIDYFLVGRTSEGRGSETRYIEKLCEIDGSVLCFPHVPEARSHTPLKKGGRPVVVCGSSLSKLTPDALELLFTTAAMVDANKVVLYPFNPAWGVGPSREAVLMQAQRVASKKGFDADKIEIVGPWESHESVLDLLDTCHLYVDSFPHSGGLSVLEALRSGLPVVYRSGTDQRSLQASNVASLTGGASLDVTTTSPSKPALLKMLGERPERTSTAQISDVGDFGHRLAAGLRSIGCAHENADLGWLDRLVVPTATLLKVGSQRKATPLTHVKTHEDPDAVRWVERGRLVEHVHPLRDFGMRHWDEIAPATFVFHCSSAGTTVVTTAVDNWGEPCQIEFVVNGRSSGWGPLLGVARGEQAVVSAHVEVNKGWNIVELCIPDAGPDASLFLSKPYVWEVANKAASRIGAQWRPLQGFSFWEWPRREQGLDTAYRWAVGPRSTIEVKVDTQGCDGIVLHLRTFHQGLVVEVLNDNETLECAMDFPGDVSLPYSFVVPGPFGQGMHTLAFESNTPDASGDERPLSFILLKVELIPTKATSEVAQSTENRGNLTLQL
ncbi:hypothetical protein BH10PSE2_BH10PSE2_07630 [soil metagenome]